MFGVEVVAGAWTGSIGLVVDGLDMLTDTSSYAIALAGEPRPPFLPGAGRN